MYIPQIFEIDNETELFEFIEQWSFGELVTTTDNELFINNLPFVVDSKQKKLYGHFAINNPQLSLLENADNLMVVFNGANTYISPNWYISQEMVPTWNFETVQVSGKARLVESNTLLIILEKLTEKHENFFKNPWKLDNISETKLNTLMKMIKGFEIDITSIKGKSKLSQNRSLEDRQAVVSGLRKQSDKLSQIIADKMELNN